MTPLWLRFAARELRSGVKGFRIFLACLALGVAAIAAATRCSVAWTWASLRPSDDSPKQASRYCRSRRSTWRIAQ